MPLKLGPIREDMDRLVRAFVDARQVSRYEEARQLLQEVEPEALRKKLQDRGVRVPWLVGIPVAELAVSYPAPKAPGDFNVVAADGSSIPPDRHIFWRFFLLNLGWVMLSYGRQPGIKLDSKAKLYFEDRDLFLSSGKRTVPIEGALLEAKRSLEELATLWEAASHAEGRTVALMDGSLILWGIQNEDKETQEAVAKEVRAHLAKFRKAGIPVVAYISYPGSHDVSNALRVWVCKRQPIDCGQCDCPERELSLALVRISDSALFSDLEPGCRTGLFESTSNILQRYGEHRIQFFYMNVGGEIARLEGPQWVMRDEEMLSLVHAVIYDQCRRSAGYPPYPPALQEAHEAAVITAMEREIVDGLLEEALAQSGTPYHRSAKAGSKRIRAV